MQYGLKKAEETLAAASSLLGKLSGEKDSWRAQAAEFQAALEHLPACSAVSAAFVVYAGAESEAVRARLLREWHGVPGAELPDGFTVEGFLSGERELAEWHSWGLPTDQVRGRLGRLLTQEAGLPGWPCIEHDMRQWFPGVGFAECHASHPSDAWCSWHFWHVLCGACVPGPALAFPISLFKYGSWKSRVPVE